MTSDQYSELVGFLGRQFENVDRRFDETRRHSTVLFERAHEELRIVAEGLNARLDDTDARIDGVEERLGGRLGSLERTVASLDASVRLTLADHEARIRGLE